MWRVPDRREDHTTVIIYHATAHQEDSRLERPRTSEEQATVDEDIEAELADAGLPLRPRGYVWCLQLPDGFTPAQVQAAIYAELDTAADVRAAMETAMARLLAS